MLRTIINAMKLQNARKYVLPMRSENRWKNSFSARDAIYGVFIVLAFVVGLVIARHHTPLPAAKNVAVHSSPLVTVRNTARPSQTDDAAAKSSSPSTSSNQATKSAPSAQLPPATNACEALSPSAATAILGAGTEALTGQDTHSITADMDTSTCAYDTTNSQASDGHATLKALVALSSVGNSENDVAFGSDRPADASSVDGYGQSAYWVQSTGELNILLHNNRYILQRNTGSSANLSDVKALADQIAPELK